MQSSKKLKALGLLAVAGGSFALYLWLVPAPTEPVAFAVPPYAPEKQTASLALQELRVLDLPGYRGPEDVAIGPRGRVYAASLSGAIVRISPDGSAPELELFVQTGGRPLGLAFDPQGRLIIADPFRGLLRVAVLASGRAGEIEVLVPAGTPTAAAPERLCYANNVDVAADGTIYFTDSTARFCPPDHGDTFTASMLDISEHRLTGRLLALSPDTGRLQVLMSGLQFANGVALAPDAGYVLLAETGNSQIHRYELRGPDRGTSRVIRTGLSGYPDNLTRGRDGRFWLGFTKPRSRLLEAMADSPGIRSLISRVPRRFYPVPPDFGHIMAIDGQGRTLEVYQDPAPAYPETTGATEVAGGLYIHSLHAKGLGWLANEHRQSITPIQNQGTQAK